MSLESKLDEVKERIAAAAARSGRRADEVTLIAVSKGFSADVVQTALTAGATELGENRAQELKEKAIAVPAVSWHFIGHLQTNKARLVVGVAKLIHSVDRPGLAEEIARRSRAQGFVQDVLLEVNVSGEVSKHGVELAGAVAFAEQVATIEGINLRGLMTMAPRSDDPENSRPFFSELRELRDLIARRVGSVTELSMGMSTDFEVGIEEGATLVRVGQAIFGPRPQR